MQNLVYQIEPDDPVIEDFPGDSALVMGVLVADVLHQGDLSDHLRGLSDDDLTVLTDHIVNCEPHHQAFLKALGLETAEPSWWMATCQPQINQEVERRTRPKWTGGGSRIAALKASLDIVEVASRYTRLRSSGTGRLKGLCPVHKERTPSFTVFAGEQRWHCFGCHGGGDVIDLIQAVSNGR